MPTQNQTPIAYTTLVRPILEYASIIWAPHTASNIHKLETIQRRSAKHIMHKVYNRHASVTTMRSSTCTYLPYNNAASTSKPSYYTESRTNYIIASISTAVYITPWHPFGILNTSCPMPAHVFKTSFFPSTIKIWNTLKPVITNSTAIPQLRQALQSTPTSGRRGAPCSAGAEGTSFFFFFFIPGLSRHLGSPVWLIMLLSQFCPVCCVFLFQPACFISLLDASFHLRFGRPLLLFPGMSTSSILLTMCSFFILAHGRTTSVVFL